MKKQDTIETALAFIISECSNDLKRLIVTDTNKAIEIVEQIERYAEGIDKKLEKSIIKDVLIEID